MYENGLGVEQSDAKAMGWYHLASRTGHRRAGDKLALLIAKSTSELGTLVEAPVAETTTAVDASTEDIAALGEAAGAAAQPVEPVEVVAREPIEPAEVVELGPVEPLETASVEPNEVAVTEPGIVVQAAEPEGPRRDPVEVVLDEDASDPDAEAALEMAVIEPAARGAVAELNAGGADAGGRGADLTEEGLEGQNDEPKIASQAPSGRVGSMDEAPPVTVAALTEGEAEVATQVEEVELSPAAPDEPAPEAPVSVRDTAESADLAAVDELEGTDLPEADEVNEEGRRSFLVAFLDALKGESRREREERDQAKRTPEPDNGEPAADEMLEAKALDNREMSAPFETALDPAQGEGEDEAPSDARVADREFAGLALDALRGEARAMEVPHAVDAAAGAERPAIPDEDEEIALGASEPPIEWAEPGATTLSVSRSAAGLGESDDETDIGTGAAEDKVAEMDGAGEQIAAIVVTEASGSQASEPPIDWDETGELRRTSIVENEPPPPGPPVEVAAREDSSAAPPVVAAALGAGADLEGLSDSERLSAGLAAYRARDYAGAVIAWLPLAERDNRMAQFYVGGLYLDGTGLPSSRVWAHARDAECFLGEGVVA